MNTRILLIRHGQSTYNAQGLYQGCCDDSVLTEKGRLTAYQTGIELSHYPLAALYSSPLQRTQETAQEVLSAISSVTHQTPPLHPHPKLREVNLPAWQGLPFQQVREQFVQDYRCWRERPHEFSIAIAPDLPVGDGADVATVSQSITFPVQELYQHAYQFWQEIVPRHAGETIAIVSHGGMIRALIGAAMGMGCTHFHALQQSNCGMSLLDVSPAQATLTAMNVTAHLGEVLPKLKDGKQGMRLLLLPIEAELTAPLKARLNQVPLEVCLTGEADRARSMVEEIGRSRHLSSAQSHPHPMVHLPIAHPDFLHIWHRSLCAQSQTCPNLCTGLVIAEAAQITSLLNQVLGLSNPKNKLAIAPNGISILYYPKAAPAPVLQSLNLTN
ncbi:histidine phosphatase family protein [Myxacorys almedinensis]|uniref:Histidine phosphatase family protein n=1 Tax=Myxacorys almedinensis A TaxID=2690445 RepID=A0A8J7Z1J5_9CYAN|nr:histidine phosphatase family protein [Myxacorys almedinensis]NDJ16448.1 histidine phosphatase family protein [Myxacorys almedinensis A]